VSPEGRAYELVSPPDKNGTHMQNWVQMGSDGESFAWSSLGGYADPRGVNVDVTYVGRRTPDGWRTTPFSPFFSENARPSLLTNLGGYAFSSDLSSMAFVSSGAFDPADRDGFGQFGAVDVYRLGASADTTWLSHGEDGIVPGGFAGARLTAVSDDGSSIFFTTTEPLTAAVPPSSVNSLLYRWRDGRVEAVGRDPRGVLLAGGSWLGAEQTNANPGGTGTVGQLPDALAVSSDGNRFVYGGRPVDGAPRQLYLAEEGRAPIQLTLSARTGSVGDPATVETFFMSATPDLDQIYFQAAEQLTDDAPADGGDYVYDVSSGTLSFSNPDDSTLSPFSVAGLVRLSDDGEYLYFASGRELAPGAVADRRNLYVRHDGGVDFIATLDDADYGVSAAPSDNSVATTDYTHAGISADGTRLVFESVASLNGAVTGGRRVIYRYDAATRALTCVSCRPDGSAPQGDATLAPPTENYKPTPRGISDDGSTIVFTTADALVPSDSNGVDDVYEHRDGVARLVSGGTSRAASTLVGMTGDTEDIFFYTTQSLVDADVDNGLRDLYDARRGGGFATTSPPTPCQGDECQGPQQSPTPIAPPASMGLEELPQDPEDGGDPRASFTPARVSASQRRALAGGRTVVLRVRVSEAGRVGVGMSARIGKRTRTVGSGRATARGASTVAVRVRLSSAARRQLARAGRLRVALAVSFSEARGTRTQTFTLRAARTSRQRGATR